MKNLFYILLFTGILLTYSCSALFEPTDFVAPLENAVISRTEGVAPLSVHFRAGFSELEGEIGDFHSLHYEWDFDNSSAGTWGTNGKEKNIATGAVTTHVFEEPGTYNVKLTVSDSSGTLSSGYISIEVFDPDIYYSGLNTICVSESGDFTGAPAGALEITTSDLRTITQYATAGSRILLKRGDNWSINSSLDFPDNSGPVHIGAFGSGTGEDELGLYSNAPRIDVNGGNFCDLNYKQNWRFSDINLVDTSESNGSFGGSMEMQHILFMNMEIEGFEVGLGWSHWNDSTPMTIDEMVVYNSRITESGMNCMYVGSERIALLGNIVENAGSSHVVRVWQAYQGIIANNLISGASIDNTNGRQALKLHGPGDKSESGGADEYGTPIGGTGLLENRTEFTVINDNIFGSSGPWPVSIGPQDDLDRCEIYDIIFERNKIITEYGEYNNRDVLVAFHIWAKDVTVRNNIFDGTGGGNDFTAISVGADGKLETTSHIDIFNNTVYRSDNSSGNYRYFVELGADSSDVEIKNNIVSFPSSSILVRLISNKSLASYDSESNLLIEAPGFEDPDNADPLMRDFSINSGTTEGLELNVFDDFNRTKRNDSVLEMGAFEL